MRDFLPYHIAGEELQLDESGAIWWKKERTLFLADLHLGKAQHFRKEGIPIPQRVQAANFLLLEHLMNKYCPMDVFFLGDLFHSEYNLVWNQFEDWMISWDKIQFHLILGNHDILDHHNYQNSRIQTYQEGLEVGPFVLYHHPTVSNTHHVLCGHIHPVVVLKGKAKSSVRLKCFFCTSDMIILPAAGAFKGGKALRPKKGDRVMVISQDGIVEVK